jgi:hypothetical protein
LTCTRRWATPVGNSRVHSSGAHDIWRARCMCQGKLCAAIRGWAAAVGVNGTAPSHEITVDHPTIPLFGALLFVEVAAEVHEQSGTHTHAKGGCLAIVHADGAGTRAWQWWREWGAGGIRWEPKGKTSNLHLSGVLASFWSHHCCCSPCSLARTPHTVSVAPQLFFRRVIPLWPRDRIYLEC